MLYYSILDTHHRLRPNSIAPRHVEMVKRQLTELLTRYGRIDAIVIDGWDAPWSRISYDEIPFEEIYALVKSLQPECVVMDLNGAKYPQDGLYYTDIKTYEMGAGQRLSGDHRAMPALACLPINGSWFWKTAFPSEPVKSPEVLVNDYLRPLNEAHCNFLLNVAPNRDGLIDDNALEALRKIGRLWKNPGPMPKLPALQAPIISPNLAKNKPSDSSWSDDMNIMDFANDDDFQTAWRSNPRVTNPWYEVDFTREEAFNAVVLVEGEPGIRRYRIEYLANETWRPLLEGSDPQRIKIHRFDRVRGRKIRIRIDESERPPSIAEFQVYNEKREPAGPRPQ